MIQVNQRNIKFEKNFCRKTEEATNLLYTSTLHAKSINNENEFKGKGC